MSEKKAMKLFFATVLTVLMIVSMYLCYLFHVDRCYGMAIMYAIIAGAMLGILTWMTRIKL